MGKTGKWLKNFLVGPKKADKEKLSVPTDTTTPATPKEKKRWSFRRSSITTQNAPAKGLTFPEESNRAGDGGNALLSVSELESEQKKHALAVAAATAAAADAAVAAAQAAAAVMRLTAATGSRINRFEDESAVKIQSAFRSYLARKALNALKGLVKLQSLIRGHLVRKQATATLRCMEALVTVQARARVQRQLKMVEDSKSFNSRPSTPKKSTRYDRFRHINHEFESEKGMEETIKIVEMDPGDSTRPGGAMDSHQVSPSPSALTVSSPRTCSGYLKDYFSVTHSSPQCYSALPRLELTQVPFSPYPDSMSSNNYPNYMANTESSRAKARSQSAPKQRAPDSFERPPSSSSRRRPSVEGRNVNNVPRFMKMQRSSSHAGSNVQNYHKPRSIKLDQSSVSLKDSECGSNSTVLTDINYCRSLVNYSMSGIRNKTLPPFPVPHHAV